MYESAKNHELSLVRGFYLYSWKTERTKKGRRKGKSRELFISIFASPSLNEIVVAMVSASRPLVNVHRLKDGFPGFALC